MNRTLPVLARAQLRTFFLTFGETGKVPDKCICPLGKVLTYKNLIYYYISHFVDLFYPFYLIFAVIPYFCFCQGDFTVTPSCTGHIDINIYEFYSIKNSGSAYKFNSMSVYSSFNNFYRNKIKCDVFQSFEPVRVCIIVWQH